MAAPPPIIRSTKPFSVEIPEGSKSAKSRRSDIVPNDELEIKTKKQRFISSDQPLTDHGHVGPDDDEIGRAHV